VANPGSKEDQKDFSKDEPEIARQAQKQGLLERRLRICEENGDLSWIDDVGHVVKHGDDEANDEWEGELSSIVLGKDF
jgi:hypothetical protein